MWLIVFIKFVKVLAILLQIFIFPSPFSFRNSTYMHTSPLELVPQQTDTLSFLFPFSFYFPSSFFLCFILGSFCSYIFRFADSSSSTVSKSAVDSIQEFFPSQTLLFSFPEVEFLSFLHLPYITCSTFPIVS